jgi:hypothetical protein
VAAIEEAIVLFIFKRRREVEQVEGASEVFEGVVQIGCGLCVFADDEVVEGTGVLVLKYGCDEEGRGTALEIFAGYPLGGGQ